MATQIDFDLGRHPAQIELAVAQGHHKGGFAQVEFAGALLKFFIGRELRQPNNGSGIATQNPCSQASNKRIDDPKWRIFHNLELATNAPFE